MLLRFLIASALALTLAACDSSDPDPDPPAVQGQGSVTISGDVSRTFSGLAFWTTDTDEDGTYTVIGVFNGNFLTNPNTQTFEFVALGRQGGRPGTGSYPLSDDETGGGFSGGYADFGGTAFTFAASETGTLTITESSSTNLQGTFNFSGSLLDLTGQTSGSVQAQGAFNARFIDPDDLPDGVEFEVHEAARAMRAAALTD